MGVRGVLAIVVCAVLGGCAESPWREGFRLDGESLPMADYRNAPPAAVREVPWSRLDAAWKELGVEVEQSREHPDDWPPERRAKARARLAEALQLPGDAGEWVFIGRSSFSSTERIRPDDGELARFGGSVGAQFAVWSSVYRGKTDKVIEKPVQTYGTGTHSVYNRQTKKWETRTATENWTTWVPIVVSADEHAYVAYFVRRR